MENLNLNFKLRIWSRGRFEDYEIRDISPDLTFLEMLDILNEKLIRDELEPIEFDSDCREGICGTCGFVVNGVAHGPSHLAFFGSGCVSKNNPANP